MFKRLAIPSAALILIAGLVGTPAQAAPPTSITGAIFTTDSTGTPVNLNIYDAKEDVYLNGGPGINAPDDAAGLPDCKYYFQVTDPSGKELLSTDAIECRQFVVVGGVITDTAGPCPHVEGTSGDDSGISVQLFPYLDTPNNGGVYKVWVTPVDLYDTTLSAPGSRHGFIPKYSKVDNFKVKTQIIVEIDARFWHRDGYLLDGLAAEWTDTNGATNIKWSEYNPAVLAFHEAHVEAAEEGTHKIKITNQPGCTIDRLDGHGAGGKLQGKTAVFTVNVQGFEKDTYFVDVYCK